MKGNVKIILIAGSTVSFVVVFLAMAFAMGLMSHGPGALVNALLGKAPAPTEEVATPNGGEAEDGATAAGEAGAGEPAHGGGAAAEAEAVAELPGSAGAAPTESEFLTRAEALSRIEEALQTRQAQMDEENETLLALQKELETTSARLDSLELEAVQHLARVYSSMRPETAAEIMMRLPASLQTAIVANMEDKNAGKVLGAMDPRAAARVSSNLGSRTH